MLHFMLMLATVPAVSPKLEFTPFLKACVESGGQAHYATGSSAGANRQVYEGADPATVTINFWSDDPGTLNNVVYILPGETQPRRRPVANGESYTIAARAVGYLTPESATPIQVCTRVR